jgi:hypothetical protein
MGGYYHVDNFDELATDLDPNYAGQSGDKPTDEDNRQIILANLANLIFLPAFAMDIAMQPRTPQPIRLVSGIDYAPYTDLPIPPSDNTTQVVYYDNLEEIYQQVKGGRAVLKNYLLILPLHDAGLFFRTLSLAGIVQINDLSERINQ